MPAVTRLGDMCTGHGCHPSRPNVGGSSNVFVNGIPAHRQSDHWPTHCCGDDCHDGVLAAGCPGVYVNGLELGRVGDPVSCGSHVAMGSGNVFAGETTDEEKFEALRDAIESKKPTQKEKLLLCLPDIAEAEAGRQDNLADAQGWLYLQSMFYKWFTGRANADPNADKQPLWVDWDWVLSYGRALAFYQGFVEHDVLNSAACAQLGRNLQRDGKLTSQFETFDYTLEPWSQWQAGYHTLQSVWWGGGLPVDGLTAALATFTFRALASGCVVPNGDGTHTITVTGISVFVHDVFNFEGYADLRSWDCPKKEFHFFPGQGKPLENKDFRDFSTRTGFGNAFLVLSRPHPIDFLQEYSYVYP